MLELIMMHVKIIILMTLTHMCWHCVNTEMNDVFQQLEKSENRYEALFSSYPDFIFRMNFEGYFLDIHAPNEKQLYLPIEKILGKKIGPSG